MLREYEKGNFVVTGGDWNQNPVGYKIGRFSVGRFSNERFSNGRFSTFDVGRNIEPVIEPDFLPDGWQWVFDPETPTNRDVNLPYQKGTTKTTIIDFFVVSPNVEVLDISTDNLGFEWSDHQPVKMIFKFK
jgi:endonuclease/exonuclease/phosphatase family metal-dependent hydrolase